MSTGVWIPLIAAAASVAAAAVSIWQARVAGSQAHSARRQAASSEEQVQLMREQLADVHREREHHGLQQRRDQIMDYVRNVRIISESMISIIQATRRPRSFLYILSTVPSNETIEYIRQEVQRCNTALTAIQLAGEDILRALNGSNVERFSMIHEEIIGNATKCNELYDQLDHTRSRTAESTIKAEAISYAEKIHAKVDELIELAN
jgi:hypothetical protein